MKTVLFILFCLQFSAGNGQDAKCSFRVLPDPKDALQCRIDLIQQAENEILLSYYILLDDLSGTLLLNLLAEAACQRGVVVRILMDRNGSKISAPMRAFLEKNGVETHRFILKNKGLKQFYHGLHEKVFIVDNQFLMVGGRNIDDKYFDLSPDFNFFDYDVLASGDSLLHDARRHFYTSWDDGQLSSAYPAPLVPEKKAKKNLEKIQSSTAEVQHRLQIKINSGTDWLADCETFAAPAGFIHDDFFVKKGKYYFPSDEKDFGSTRALVHFIDSAKTTVFIENPYFIPTKTWDRAFKNALRRGVKIRLLTNSVQSTDLLIRQAAYLNLRKKMLRWGMEIWEFQGSQKLHAKALVIDSQVVIIGSYNIHRPSELYNTESAVWVKDKKTAQNQLKIMAANLEKSQQIGAGNRPIHRPGKNFPRPKFGRRAKVFLLRCSVSKIFGWLL